MYIVYDTIKNEILSKVKYSRYSIHSNYHEAIFEGKQEAIDFALERLEGNDYAREGDVVVFRMSKDEEIVPKRSMIEGMKKRLKKLKDKMDD